jgi:hypothetical protein
VEVDAYQGRAAQRIEDVSSAGRYGGYRLSNGGANPCRFGAIISQAFGEGSNQFAIGAEPEDFVTGHSSLGETSAVIFQSALLSSISHLASSPSIL